MKMHIIQHDFWVNPGEYTTWADKNGYRVSVTKCWEHEALPESVDADMLIILGGLACPATTLDECDFFDAPAERAFIKRYIDAGKMVIGVCLGAQLIGEALGAKFSKSPEREIGPVRANLTKEGRNDPFLAHFPDEFDAGEWHNDMPGLTEDCTVLAYSEGCPRQIIRYGKYVYGFQTHMEFTPSIIADGIKYAGVEAAATDRFVQTEEELLAYDYTEMNRLLAGFLDAMAADYFRR